MKTQTNLQGSSEQSKGGQVADIRVDISHGTRAAASWTDKHGRYHVWFDTDTLNLLDERIIYKNPHLGVERNSAGDFNTRFLRIDVPKNLELVRQVFSEIGATGAIAKAKAEEQEKRRVKQAEHDAYIAAEKLKESAPQLQADNAKLTARVKVLEEALQGALFFVPLGTEARKRADSALDTK